MNLRLSELAPLVLKRRGHLGVRAAAAEVGISSATFSRIENGQMPDLETFAKICKWLEVDPNQFLGTSKKKEEADLAVVHFGKDRADHQETATSLAKLILVAREALRAQASLME